VFAISASAYAGGPKYVAGHTGFNPAALGQPLHWPGGKVSYFVDRGALSATISNEQATALVDAAAAIWNAVPTAGVSLINKGSLNEDVNAANILVNQSGQIVAPSDVTPSASNDPVAVLFDYDGAVIDAIYGPTASDPGACHENGVFVWVDNFQPDATFAHGVILLNGRCATNSNLIAMMSFQVERAFGRILGLDFSQVNPGPATSGVTGVMLGWPVMQPISGMCGANGGECIPNPATLRFDDIAALNRLYPITAANVAQFPGKKITADNTLSIHGKISFASGYGMQGVNVVARPLDAQGNPLYQYTVTAVSGALFRGKHGNAITGWIDANGDSFTRWGSDDADLQGAFDLSGIPLPPGMTSASYQVSFEAIDPLYILSNSVGPYADAQVAPSGTLNSVALTNLCAGNAREISIIAADSATGGFSDAIATASQPRRLPSTGFWYGRLSQVGQTDWFAFPVRGNRTFTVVTQALDERGTPTGSKALPSIGIWDAFKTADAPAVGAGPGLNGFAVGETWLRVASSGDDVVRIAIADLRGDGRPDYAYDGWVLYADTVEPALLPASGGPIVIHGMGFHANDTVMVNGQPALVTSITPNEITAVAPAATKGVSGSVDVEVDGAPIFYAAAIISGGLSYDAGKGDALKLVSAPANTVPIGTPIPFTVTALDANLHPVGGVSVLYSVTGGTAGLGCGLSACTVTTSGDGRATINVTATDREPAIVTASLTNSASLQAHFNGGTPATLTALTPQLSVAAGATVLWRVQTLALSNGIAAVNQQIVFQPGNGITVRGSTSVTTNASGIATTILTVGPLARAEEASIKACLNGTTQCVTFTAFGARPEYASLQPVSGTLQTLAAAATPAQIVLRLLDINGNAMAGGSVQLFQSLYAWTPPCVPHVPCKGGALLATQSATATSDLDGIVIFAPASLPGVATGLQALAVSGNSSTINIAIEQH
jgi:hypothetical protein